MIKRDFIISVISLSLGIFLLFKKEDRNDIKSTIATTTLKPQNKIVSRRLYGMVISDNIKVIEDRIKPHQNLSEILSLYNISVDVIQEVVERSKGVFDLKKIIPERKYVVFCNKNADKKTECFIYEPNEYEYVVCNLSDTINISRHYRKVDTITNSISGVIQNSLFESLMENGSRPEFAFDLAEVFKWQIDFYKVQKGDKFKVIFQEILVEGKPVAIGKIIGALFNHNGEDYYAINFNQGNGQEYFDNNGKNLQKAFLKSPLKFSRISSKFSLRRFHPVTGIFKLHLGTDYAAPIGTPIHSVGDGVIVEAKYTAANGKFVKIRHDQTYATQYLHMSKIASGINIGKRVSQGETIGFVGSTGLATGPHLCFRFWKDGVQIDALKVKIPPTEPVHELYRSAFDLVKEDIMQKLDGLSYSNSQYIASAK